jgi:hypothetical protein
LQPAGFGVVVIGETWPVEVLALGTPLSEYV